MVLSLKTYYIYTVAPDDDVKDAETLASKVVKMKCWDDDQGGKVGA